MKKNFVPFFFPDGKTMSVFSGKLMNFLRQVRLLHFVLVCLFIFLPFQSVFSGNGSITLAPPNTFGIRGLLNFSINFRYVPTPADLVRLRQAIRDANDVICDATDGQIVFGTVTITAGAVGEDQADVWILPQGGRSFVSFWTDGSGLRRLGSHIILFQGAVVGDILAHELGHLAFGFGDQYDEQCRWGGACGIGPCFDAGTINDRNNSIMQQSPGASELTVAANQDLLRGSGGACNTPGLCDTTMFCNDPASCGAWNTLTRRYETTQHTLMHGLLSEWQVLSNNYPALGLVIPALPVAALPGNCQAFLFIDDTKINATNLVCLVIDRSGSMTIKDAGDASRMDFAKAASKAFLDVSLSFSTGSTSNQFQVGIVSFNETSRTDRTVQLLTSSNIGLFKTSIDGLVANGSTAIGDGLISGGFELAGKVGANPTLFLLSDGENNAGTSPAAATGVLESRNFRVFTIPVGNGADRSLLSDIASSTGGVMMDAARGDMIPPIYIEMAALYGGHSLVLPRTEFAVKGKEVVIFKTNGPTEPDVELQKYTVNVETNAKSLVVFLSNRNPVINTWTPGFRINGPGGQVITQNDKNFIKGDLYYQIVSIPNPNPGSWTIELFSGGSSNTFGHVLAFLENPNPDLHVDAFPKVAQLTDTVTISATASYLAELDERVNFQGTVKRPDGSVIPVTFTRNSLNRTLFAPFHNYNGRGIYEATVQAVAPATTKILSGESVFVGPADPGIVVLPFERKATAAFFVNAPALPPNNTTDCDNDGLPNNLEDSYPPDVDGDGIPNRCDEDSDGDDIPDATEGTKDTNQNGIPDVIEDNNPRKCPKTSKISIKTDSLVAPGCKLSNGIIKISVNGGAGKLTYKWNHKPTLNAAIASDLPDGIYSVTVTDAEGCSASEVFNLKQDCSQQLIVVNNCQVTIPEGCIWTFHLKVDMRKIPAPDNLLGSFTGKLSWDPKQLVLDGSPLLLSGYTGFFKADAVVGTLSFNGVSATGVKEVVDLLKTNFLVKGKAGEKISMKVEFSVAASANTFTNLLPFLLTEICEPTIIKGGILGDVNEDNKVNSTDGLIIMSNDVGKPIPIAFKNRIDAGFGDVNFDKATNSTDALIILSYELGFSVPYPIGKPFCPASLTSGKKIVKKTGKGAEITALSATSAADENLIDVPIYVNMQGTGETLGSLTATLHWDTDAFQLLTHEGGKSIGFGNPVVNDAELSQGKLTFSTVNPKGGEGLVNVYNLHFRKLKPISATNLSLSVSTMAAANTFADLQPTLQTKVDVKEGAAENNLLVFPNPFGQSTNIIYQVTAESNVEITAYNQIGQKVGTLVNRFCQPGRYSQVWEINENVVKPGLYILKMRAGAFTKEHKVIVVK